MKGSIDMTYRQPTTIRLPRPSHLLATRSPRYYPWVIAGVLFGHIAVFAGMTQLQPTPMLLPPPKPVQIRLVELAPSPPKALPEPAAPRVPEPVKPKVVPVVPSPPVAKTPPKLVPTVAPTAKPIAKPVDRVAEPASVAVPTLVSSVPSAMSAPVVTPPVPQPQPAAPVLPVAAVADPTPRTVAIDGVAYKRQPQVQYPEQARRRGDTGTVLVRALIDGDGRVESVSVEQSSGHRLLDQAAVRAVNRAAFHPYRENGIAQSVYTLIPIAFSLNED